MSNNEMPNTLLGYPVIETKDQEVKDTRIIFGDFNRAYVLPVKKKLVNPVQKRLYGDEVLKDGIKWLNSDIFLSYS